MNKSKILVLLLAVLMIISVSAVSAAEDIADSADVLAQDDSTTLEADDAVDVQADPEPAAEPAANFTTLQTEISNAGNNLTLEKDYTRVTDENDIVITKNFTIDGQDKYTLDAKNLGGIFKVCCPLFAKIWEPPNALEMVLEILKSLVLFFSQAIV